MTISMCDHFIQHYLMQYITGIIVFLRTNLLSIFYQITWFSSNQITRYYLKQSTAYMKRIKKSFLCLSHSNADK